MLNACVVCGLAMAGSELKCEQLDCVYAALEGHNFDIFGEAGTGKSKVVSEICRRIRY